MRKGHLIILIAASLILLRFLTGCKAKTVYIPVHSATTVTELKHDTIVEIQLTPFHDSVVVSDTISRLENRYARSEAKWFSGKLSHSLTVKEIEIPVKIRYLETIRTDSIAVPYPIPGPEKIVYRLKWWQEALMWGGIVAVISFVVFVASLMMRNR